MSIKKECDRCQEKVERFRDLKKINGERICKTCYVKNRENRRADTLDNAEDKEELIKLTRKVKAEYNRRSYKNKAEQEGRTVREWTKQEDKVKEEREYIPKRYREDNSEIKIKGSKADKKKEKTHAYISFHEKQNLLRILMDRGLNFEEAKERIKDNVQQQKKIREDMKQQKKSEEDIKIKQQEMLEELWK